MGDVLVTYKVMPDSPEAPLQEGARIWVPGYAAWLEARPKSED